jgi:hypothetical protein
MSKIIINDRGCTSAKMRPTAPFLNYNYGQDFLCSHFPAAFKAAARLSATHIDTHVSLVELVLSVHLIQGGQMTNHCPSAESLS